MWNWLMECYHDGLITLEELEEVMKSDRLAKQLWLDFATPASDFIDYVRDEVRPFIKHIKENNGKNPS